MGKNSFLYPFDPYPLRSGRLSKAGALREVTSGSDFNNNITISTIAQWSATKTTKILRMCVSSSHFGPLTAEDPGSGVGKSSRRPAGVH